MKEISINKTDHGKTFQIKIGSLIVIRLPENPTTGFKWKIIEINNEIVILKNTSYQISSDSGIGAGGTRIFSIGTIAEGTTKIELKLLQVWEPQNFVDSFEVTVVIKKTIE